MADLKNSFDKYSEQSDDSKNESSNELVAKIEDYAKSVGEKTKSKFDLILPNIEIPDSLKGLMDQIGNKLNSYLNEQINDLKNLAINTTKELIDAGKDFLYNLAKKGIDMLASRVYLPDAMFLAKVMGLYYTGEDLKYNNDYCRKVVITKDMPLTLRWINFVYGISYSILETKQAVSDLKSLTRYSCLESIDYILGCFKEERDRFITIRNTYDKENDKEMWNKYNELALRSQKFILRYLKETIVYSVGNLTVQRLDQFISKYELKPIYLGTTDEEFSQQFKITQSDVNIIAPFWNYNEHGKSFIKRNNLIKDGKLPKYINPRNIWIKYIYVYLVDKGIFLNNVMYNWPLYERLCYPTMDVFTEALDDALADFGSALKNYLNNRDKIYEYTKEVESVLKDPTKVVYAKLVSYGQVLPPPSMDDAGNFYPPTTIDPNSPSNGGSSSGTGGSSSGNGSSNNTKPNLPPGFEDIYDGNTNYKPLPGNDFNSDSFENLSDSDKNSYMRNVMHYYFLFIREKEHATIFKELYNDLKEIHLEDSTGISEVAILLLQEYYTPTYNTKDFNEDLFFKNIILSTIEERWIKTMVDIRMEKILNKVYSEATSEEKNKYLKVFVDNYNFLKSTMYNSVISSYTDLEVFEFLVFTYNCVGNNLSRVYHTEHKEEIITFFHKFFPNAYRDPLFEVRVHLKTLTDETRKGYMKEIIDYCDNAIKEKKYDTTVLKYIHEAILIEFLPAYQFIIDSSRGVDIDINDPSIKDMIRNELSYGKNEWYITLDFNDKITLESTEYEYDDLSKDYDYKGKLYRND